MTKPIIAIHDMITGEITEREMTQTEIAQLEIDKQTAIDNKAAEVAKAAAKAALLAKLGIDEEEAKLLLS